MGNTLVYKYGARPPRVDGAIREQIKLAREYYNALVEAENARRRRIWGDEKPPPPPHDHVEGDAPCQECAAFWREMYAGYRAAEKAEGLLDVKPFRAKAAASGLYWGTYLMVEEAFSAAWKKRNCLLPVKFKSWRSGGVMGVQVQKARNPSLLFDVEKAEDPRTGRRAGQRHTIRVRVGSDSGSKPVWSDPVGFEMHRPALGTPTWVEICLKYVGDREVWSVNITCADVPPRSDNAESGCVAIDVSWRSMPDGKLRLAYARGDDGTELDLSLDSYWRERNDRADRIRKYRDDMLNIIKARYRVLARHKKPRPAVEHVLRDGLQEDIELQGWVNWDNHMWRYELGCRRKSVAARRDVVRNWLRSLRRRYAVAIIKDSSHKEMKVAKKSKKDGIPQAARRQGHLGAPGEIIEEVCKVFGREVGVAVVEAPWTTSKWTCESCSHDNGLVNGKAGAQLFLSCERCGTAIDRDRVSTRNLLERHFAGRSQKLTARKSTPRFAKRHKRNDERLQD